MARYTIHAIREPDFSEISTHIVYDTDDGFDATAYARRHSHELAYGYAVVDNAEFAVDFGTETRALANVAQIEP